MTPIFGKGVVFDAPPERRREMLHNQALRDKFMRGHAATIAAEVEHMVAAWGDEGEIDLLEWFAELTIYTSSACLIGTRFRRELDGRFAQLYHDLERGRTIAYVDPYADIESFHRRDAARVALVELVSGIMDRRAAGPPPAETGRRTVPAFRRQGHRQYLLRGVEVGARGVRDGAADGAGGDGRARRDRAARPDANRHGHGPGP